MGVDLEWEIGSVLTLDTGAFQPVVNYPTTGYDTARLEVGRLNHDGYPDVVALNAQGSNITVLLSNGDGTLQAGTDYLVGLTPISVAVGNFNRDRASDLAVADENANEVSVLLNTGSVLNPQSER